MRQIKQVLGTVALAFILFTSCTEENQNGQNKVGDGNINIYLTDAPFPIDLVSETFVTINKIEVRRQESDSSGTDFIVLSEDTTIIDLLTLSNGVTHSLASVNLETGSYDMIRLHVTDAKVVLNDNTEFQLKIPSSNSSGLKVKIEPSIEINDGQTTDVLLDFDVSKSFAAKGNWKQGRINGFNFKPVVHGILMERAGRIEGMVIDTAGLALENASIEVWIPQQDTIIDSLHTTAFSNEDGNYKVVGLKAGTYHLIANLEGYLPDTIQNVKVSEAKSTIADFELAKND